MNNYTNNRQRLTKILPNAKFVLIGGNALLSKSADNPYYFRQDSNMIYLTGIKQPSSSLLIDTVANKSYLVLPKLNKIQELFEGVPSHNELTQISGCDAVISYKQLAQIIKKQQVYFNLPPKKSYWGVYSNPFRSWLKNYLKNYKVDFKDIRPALTELRMVKQAYEVNNISRAVEITKMAIDKYSPILWQNGMTEDRFYWQITSFFAQNDISHAYTPIVAAGKNAAVLHHEPTQSPTCSADMVLLDIGATYKDYNADISRTITKQPDPIYEDLKNVQKEIIKQLKPGVLLKDIHNKSFELVTEIAQKHNLKESVKRMYPQAIGHHLGLDVHDAADYKQPLKEGNVITIEPGLCSTKHGFGYRVEDDVLITSNGAKVL